MQQRQSDYQASGQKKRSSTELPPCSRHHRPGNFCDQRVRDVYLHVLDLVGKCPDRDEMKASLFCLHDHKGTLHVVSRRPLPEYCIAMLSVAWQELGNEHWEAVELHALSKEAIVTLSRSTNYGAVLDEVVGEL